MAAGQVASPQLLVTAQYVRHLDPSVDKLKLQKLLYVIQGSYLAQTGQLIFPEAPEAWTYGPVYREIYVVDHEITGDVTEAGLSLLAQDRRDQVEAAVDVYRNVGAISMMHQTHEPGPWTEARGDVPDIARSKEHISHHSMLLHFSEPGNAVLIPSANVETVIRELPANWVEEASERWSELLERLGS